MNGPRATNPSTTSAAPTKSAATENGKSSPSTAANPSATYEERNRQEDPVPTEADKPKVAVILSDCKFVSKPPELAIEKDCEVSCKASWSGEQAPDNLRVTFKFAMKWDDGGKSKEEDALKELEGHLDTTKSEQTVTAKGTLPRPPSFPEDGTIIEYRLVASHPAAASTAESAPVKLKVLEVLHHAEVRDVLFAHGGHFPCLDENGWLLDALSKSIGWAKESGEQLVVFGHSDTSGSQRSNYEVSERRSQASLALLARDVDVWEKLAKNHHQTDEIQACLKGLFAAHGWACDPGSVDGEDGQKTKTAVKAFQDRCNQLYTLGLKTDGVVDPSTWKAMHRVICGLLATRLGVPDPPDSIYPQWDAPDLGYPEGQGAYACGESFPIEAANFDGLYSQKNRRVDFLFGSGWNFLKPPPSKDKGLTKAQCPPFDPDKVRWEPIGGATPSPGGGGTEPPAGPAILELSWEKTVVVAWDSSDQAEMKTKVKVKTQEIAACDDAVLEVFQFSTNGSHVSVLKLDALKLEADALHLADGSELEVMIGWHDHIYDYGKTQFFCKLTAQGQEKVSGQDRAGLLQLKHHDGVVANPSGDLPGAGVEGAWVDDYLRKLGLWLEATNDEIIADGHRVHMHGSIDNAGMKTLLERNKFLHHQSSHGTAYCLCDGNKNYVEDTGVAGADGVNDWLCPVCHTCNKAVGVIMNKDFTNLFFREEVRRLSHSPKVLVLANCCLTSITPDYPREWLAKGTRWYVGWAVPVLDKPAVEFSKAFYRRWFGAYRMDPDKIRNTFNDVKAPYAAYRPRIFGS